MRQNGLVRSSRLGVGRKGGPVLVVTELSRSRQLVTRTFRFRSIITSGRRQRSKSMYDDDCWDHPATPSSVVRG